MTHKKYQRMLVLSLSGDLEKNETAELERHLATCAGCRRERAALEKLNGFSTVLHDAVQVDDALLTEARSELHVLLQREARASRGGGRFMPALHIRPAWGYSLGFALTLVVGVGIGLMRPFQPGEQPRTETHPPVTTASMTSPLAGRTRITNVQFLDRGTTSGTVEFTFDAVTPVHMRGTVDDPGVQKVLVSALLNDDNPGVRLSAANAFASGTPVKSDSAIKTVMIKALLSDPNIGVRKQALAALRSMPFDDQIRAAFLATLKSDANPGLRIAAINGLDPILSQPGEIDQSVRDVLQQRARSDRNDYIRLKAKAVLLEKQ